MRTNLLVAMLLVTALLLTPWAVRQDPLAQQRANLLAPPSWQHWLGTDEYGRDLLARFVYGARWSIGAGLAATAVCLSIALALGTAAVMMESVGGIILWTADLFLTVPWLYLLIAVRAALPLALDPRATFLLLLLLIAGTGWARPARLIRGKVLEVRQRGYVQAAIGFSVPKHIIFVRHILPATGDVLLAQTILLLPRFVLAEVTLSFLGVGSAEPWPSWGALIAPLKQIYLVDIYWWRLLPVIGMVPFFIFFAIAGRRIESKFRLSR